MSDLLLDSSDELELSANFATDGDPVYSICILSKSFGSLWVVPVSAVPQSRAN